MSGRSVWWLVVATAACTVLQLLIMNAADVAPFSEAAFRNAFPIVNVATVVGALVGAVILTRHPGHPIGWLFCWGQFGVAVGLVLRAAADASAAGVLMAPGWLSQVADLLATLLGSMFALALLAVWLLLAPDGQLASRRWRVVLIGLAVGYGVLTLGVMAYLVLGEIPVTVILVVTGQFWVVAALAASVVSLLVRMRRATGETRQQLRWIAAAATVLTVAPVAALLYFLLGFDQAPAWVVLLLHLGYLGVPLATGFAVLRYRLYDIDRLIVGSVVLAVLAVLALAGYVLAVGFIGVTVPGTIPGSGWSVLIFVLVVLAFQPLRRSVRRLADRLVYGPQAMTYEALARFTRGLAQTPQTPLLPAVAESAARLVNADQGTAVVWLPDGTTDRAEWSAEGRQGRPVASGSALVVPVQHAGVQVGQLELVVPDLPSGAARRRALVTSFADRIAEPFAHHRLAAELRDRAHDLDRLNRSLEESRQRLLAVRDVSRRHVAGRIRSEVIDCLLPVAERLSLVEQIADTDPDAATAQVEEALAVTTSAIDRLRQITGTVYSRRLTDEGLAAALRAEDRADGSTLTVVGDQRWSAAVESVLFACCSDVLRGLVGDVTIRVEQVDQAAQVGFAFAAAPPDGPSLLSVQERIEVLGGTVAATRDQLVLRLPLIDLPAGTAD